MTNNIDARHTTTTNHKTMVDMNNHNQVMNVLHTHASQFGAYVQQRQLSHEQMQRLPYTHLQRAQAPAIPPLIIHMPQLPPPPPEGAGAIVAAMPLPAPEAVPAPTIPASVLNHYIGSVPPGLGSRSRGANRSAGPPRLAGQLGRLLTGRWLVWSAGWLPPTSLHSKPPNSYAASRPASRTAAFARTPF